MDIQLITVYGMQYNHINMCIRSRNNNRAIVQEKGTKEEKHIW